MNIDSCLLVVWRKQWLKKNWRLCSLTQRALYYLWITITQKYEGEFTWKKETFIGTVIYDISMSLYKYGHCLLLKKVWIYSVLLDHLAETFLGTFILNMISPCHYYLRRFSESRSSCGSTPSVHPSETLLGCLVCVIHSFLFKLCIMVVLILKMCTFYFMHISWIFSHFSGLLNFDIIRPKVLGCLVGRNTMGLIFKFWILSG